MQPCDLFGAFVRTCARSDAGLELGLSAAGFSLAPGEDAPFDLLVTDYSRDGSGEEACCDVFEEIGERHPQVGAERADVEANMVDLIKALSEFLRTLHTSLDIIN